MKFVFLFIFVLLGDLYFGQVIPASRRADWTNPGLQIALPMPTVWKDIMTFGGNKTGTADNTTAINNAIASLSGAAGVIYFPAGTYLFNSTINVPAHVIVKGASSDSTFFNFNLGGATTNCFNVLGTASATPIPVSSAVNKGTTSLTLTSASGINVGDYIEFRVDGTGFMTSSWAMDDLAQICKVAAVAGSTITLAKPLRWNYNLSTNPRVYTMTPVQQVGFECFKISRFDTSANQSTMINFVRAANCWVKGVESFKTTFAHVSFAKSIHCELTESYLHHAWSYGDGGRAYGVVLQSSASECLVQNNIFEHLRHSFLFQSGANGNVTAYNFSTDPYWTQGFFPTNSTGEITLHGNFPFMNLFEGNIVDNIVIDNSHGNNGPFNTLFRNRGANYGIFMNTGAGDSTNFVNNELSKSSVFFTSTYSLTGNGNFEYGNNQNGITRPTGTATPPDGTSYYLSATPSWFTTGTLPNIGYSSALNSGNIPARARFLAGSTNRCACPLRTPPASCSFMMTMKLTPMPACCITRYFIELQPLAPAISPITYFYDNSTTASGTGVPYHAGEFASRAGANLIVKARDANGCESNTITVALP